MPPCLWWSQGGSATKRQAEQSTSPSQRRSKRGQPSAPEAADGGRALARAFCDAAEPLLLEKQQQHEQENPPSCLRANNAWDARVHEDVLAGFFTNPPFMPEGSYPARVGQSLLGKLVLPFPHETMHESTWLVDCATKLMEQRRLPETHKATLRSTVQAFKEKGSLQEKGYGYLNALRTPCVSAMVALFRAEQAAGDVQGFVERTAAILGRASLASAAAGRASGHAASGDLLAHRDKDFAARLREGETFGRCRGWTTAAELQRTANDPSHPRHEEARREYDELQKAAADEGGYIETAAPGRCRNKQATVALCRTVAPVAQLLQPVPFDLQELHVQLNHPLYGAEDPTLLPGIARASVQFLGGEGTLLAPSAIATSVTELCARMSASASSGASLVTGSVEVNLTEGSHGVQWLDFAIPGHVGSFREMGASDRSLRLIKFFNEVGVPWLAQLCVASLTDDAVWLRLGWQPCSTIAVAPPKLHIDAAADETCNGLGKVVVRLAISASPPFKPSNSSHVL